jgi:hypothetical protein
MGCLHYWLEGVHGGTVDKLLTQQLFAVVCHPHFQSK